GLRICAWLLMRLRPPALRHPCGSAGTVRAPGSAPGYSCGFDLRDADRDRLGVDGDAQPLGLLAVAPVELVRNRSPEANVHLAAARRLDERRGGRLSGRG